MVSTLEQMQVPNGTGPGVRRSKRPLLASRTRCNVLWKPPKFGNKFKIGITVQFKVSFKDFFQSRLFGRHWIRISVSFPVPYHYSFPSGHSYPYRQCYYSPLHVFIDNARQRCEHYTYFCWWHLSLSHPPLKIQMK